MLKKIIFLISILIISSCKENQDSLLNEFQVESSINYYKQIDDDKARMWLTDDNKIEGFANNYKFHTENNFQTLSLLEVENVNEIAFTNFSDMITHTPIKKEWHDNELEDKLAIKYSNNFGESYFNTLHFDREFDFSTPDVSFQGTNEIQALAFLNAQKGWLINYRHCDYCLKDDDEFQIYSIVNGEIKLVYKLTYWNHNFPNIKVIDAAFINSETGYVLYKEDYDPIQVGIIYNGGKDFGIGYNLPYSYGSLNKIKPLTEDIILAYNFGLGSAQLFRSENRAKDWEKIQCNCDRFTELQFINATTGFMLCNSDSYNANNIGKNNILKTTDSGKTWVQINEKVVYGNTIHFKDELNGIAYGSGIIQKTKDGGKSWELLVFPPNVHL